MNLRQLIDETIEHPPPLRLEAHLRDGRRAVRRRRATAILGGGATALVVVTLAVSAPWAGTSALPSGSPSAPSSGPSSTYRDGGPVTPQVVEFSLAGDLVLQPGWRVVERIDRPVTQSVVVDRGVRQVPDRSVAMAVTDGARTEWVLAWWSDYETNMSSVSSEPDDSGPRTLRDFVEIQVALETDGATDAVVAVGPGDVMTGRNGVEIHEQRSTPELDRGSVTTAVAKVSIPGSHPSPGWVLLVRTPDGVNTYPILGYPVVNSTTDNGPDTITGFVDWVAPLVAEGRYP